MATATQIKWEDAHYKWSDFKLGDAYTRYIQETYGITVESGGRVIWDHVLKVVEVVITVPGGAGPDQGPIGKGKKKSKRTIKLIFIMDGMDKTEEKAVKDLVPPKVVIDLQEKIEEELKTKISLSNVQIIKG